MTAFHILFLAAFIGGLVLAVIAMLHGVEHTRRDRERAPSAFFNLPALAAFAIGFGAVGYPLTSHTRLPLWAILLIASGSGLLTISAMITLLARWALRGISVSTPIDNHEIQGQLAVVIQAIPASGGVGQIAYEYLGSRKQTSARALSNGALAVGTECVIDRIENGVAFVEEWAVVEERL